MVRADAACVIIITISAGGRWLCYFRKKLALHSAFFGLRLKYIGRGLRLASSPQKKQFHTKRVYILYRSWERTLSIMLSMHSTQSRICLRNIKYRRRKRHHLHREPSAAGIQVINSQENTAFLPLLSLRCYWVKFTKKSLF